METHGTGWSKIIGCPQLPDSRPEWEKACMDRLKALYNRDKNHTCVVCWSLGNESLGGETPKKMYKWIKDATPADLCILSATVILMKKSFPMFRARCTQSRGTAKNMQ